MLATPKNFEVRILIISAGVIIDNLAKLTASQ